MRRFLSVCAVVLAPAIPVEAEDLRGMFRTEPDNAGVVLHVEFRACQDDPAKTCGVIKAAFDRRGEPREDFPHLGRRIVWGVEDQGRGRYAGGLLWSRETDRILRSKLRHRGDKLKVSGCIGPVCRAETWQRLE